MPLCLFQSFSRSLELSRLFGRVLRAEGVCLGQIAHGNRGEGGFGYDPIFEVGDKTFAEMSGEEKDAVSHRGIALRAFAEQLEKWLQEGVYGTV